jgi:hypothetical protein
VAEYLRKRARWVALLLAAWVALAAIAVASGVNRSERDLARRVEQVLSTAGLTATVEISGRDAILSGDLNPADQARAVELARSVTGIRRAQWATTPVASDTTVPPISTSTTVASPSTTSSTSSTSTTLPPASTSTTDVTVLGDSIEGDVGGELPRTGSELGIAFLGITMAILGTVLVRRARRWELFHRRIALLPGLRHEDGSEVFPPISDRP